ncbi:hypothetical protein [Streptomyces sp. NPDC058092]|uniref:hypothetical protein n=1 Tax=Streptomyces sp. NPDC058092 TaxID=3346336 RepID=UPI0036EE0B72
MSEREAAPAFEPFTATDGGIAVAETTTNDAPPDRALADHVPTVRAPTDHVPTVRAPTDGRADPHVPTDHALTIHALTTRAGG